MNVHQFGLVLIIGLALAPPPLAAEDGGGGILPYRDAGVVAQGQELYADHCAVCHGAELEGEENWRSRDADGYLPAPPHDASGHTWHHPDSQLIDITRRGIEAIVGNGYKSRMIGFADVLTDAEIISILAYIKSTWPTSVIDRHNQLNATADD
ncbi:cytochrome c [Lutimaribacter sp. EGI FJ00013]|uniref:Cytochrome c n=1 Tax=Lutimaribacter degradans TaxID=2945989 RepID=A0ACC5ZYJ8_9RHOB|nr:cytochrome c [Lutimaribacter sp. EGI FJ00013]MCM2562614.1 cytochrome c [Lutimaribacter sp. EGI FJ00013]